jgi:electron transfer flavoprotein beta subunit
MKIAVLVKEVPDDPTPRLDPGTLRLDRSGASRLNPFDANAVEEALRLRGEGDEVVLISMGPASAVEALRKGLAMGADRAVLVADEAAAGSDLVATSAVLAKTLEREQPDLVLVGQQAADGDGAVLGAAVAERLRRPLVSQAAEVSLREGKLEVRRQTEFGYDRIEAPLPAVVAVSDAINEPRYPSLKGIMASRQKSQETLSLSELGLAAETAGEAGSKTTVRALAPPPARGETLRISGEGEAAEKIVEFLVERRLL